MRNRVARSTAVSWLALSCGVGIARAAFAQNADAGPPPTAAAPSEATAPEPEATPDAKVAKKTAAIQDAAAVSAGNETGAEADLLRPQVLSIYGFSDFGFNKFYTSERSQLNALFPSKAGTFVLGNLNLFFDAQPYEDWRTLMEIRFTNLPNGYEQSLASPLGTQYARENTNIDDFTSPSIRGPVALGSIIIERAQTEYAFSDALHVMGGYFFTPLGIWNVDHGTPTLISLLLPSFMADGYIPARQLGLQAYGSFYTSNWELGYNAYVGNNRSPSQVDFRDDKSVGGRLFASSTGSAMKTRFGASGYYGHGSDIKKEVVSFIPYLTKTTETVSYREWIVGADASIDAGPLRLRTEGVLRRVDYEPGKRDGQTPNHCYTDGYVIAAYQLPWAGLEPYTYFEAIHWPNALGDTALIPSVGLTVHFNPAVQLKTQYGHAMFFDFSLKEHRTPSDNNVDNFAARLVVSF